MLHAGTSANDPKSAANRSPPRTVPDDKGRCGPSSSSRTWRGLAARKLSKTLKCDQCSYVTCYPSRLTRHRRGHTKDFLWCHLCSSHFWDKSQLVCHLKAHAGMIVCDVCGKKYSSTSGLARHKKCHMLK
ncbi:endothelial zinc finger protein induced by tumor necrosis factor alpha-like [Gigantopelta aegis]|uniref:endothelial zinc finger protein induced by tumor necrosis factor alpha-like n=1 Tax=Gigantopelta aegis TaxID=1735272 RepID=UPI001B88BABF|nr:endothelial zinc finger protein induced by tumor necrosis factor alpha-like [Gigantopelta aegis]